MTYATSEVAGRTTSAEDGALRGRKSATPAGIRRKTGLDREGGKVIARRIELKRRSITMAKKA